MVERASDPGWFFTMNKTDRIELREIETIRTGLRIRIQKIQAIIVELDDVEAKITERIKVLYERTGGRRRAKTYPEDRHNKTLGRK